jgi:hypothetical protein
VNGIMAKRLFLRRAILTRVSMKAVETPNGQQKRAFYRRFA